MSISALSKDVESLLSELGEGISDLKSTLKEGTSSKVINSANDKLSEVILLVERLKTLKVSYKLEIDSASSHVQSLHSRKLLQYEDTFASYMVDVEKYTEQLREISTYESVEEKLKHETRAKKLISWGDKVQDKTQIIQESINNMNRITNDAERIGDDIMRDLERQTETLSRVQRNFSNVDTNVTNAKMAVNTIAKSILRDKFVKVMITAILILGIACLSLYLIITPFGGSNNNRVVTESRRGPPPRNDKSNDDVIVSHPIPISQPVIYVQPVQVQPVQSSDTSTSTK